jgi:capsular polysaccharide biosynthesis protein
LFYGDSGLLVGADGALYPDSFGTSRRVPGAVRTGTPSWKADLPIRIDYLPGTWIFAEMLCAHFGHVLFDTPSRLWPLKAGLIEREQIDGILGHGMMGAGLNGLRFPRYARELVAAIGIAPEKIRFVTRPVEVERLIVPRRIAPYDAVWHPIFARMMRSAGERLVAGMEGDTPRRIWLSRSRFKADSRGGPGLAPLDALAECHGFTVVHPQTLPFRTQIALARNASHIAGPVGSQLHLCAFAAQANVKVLTVSPSYFQLPFNNMLVEDIGGRETHFAVPLATPKGLAHQMPWAFDSKYMDDLSHTMRTWLHDD